MFEFVGEFFGLSGPLTWSDFRQNVVGDAGLLGIINFILVLLLLWREANRASAQDIDAGYNDLDTLYHRLLEQRIARPWLKDLSLFQDGQGTSQREAMAAYRTHAYAVWTLLESIRDRLACERRHKLRVRVQQVWQPIIRAEGATYLDELREFSQREHAFQADFLRFVRAGGFAGIYPRKSADEAATQKFAALAAQKLGPMAAAAAPVPAAAAA